MSRPDMSYLTDIHFGCGRIERVPQLLRQAGVRRPLIITDPGLAALGMVARVGLTDPLVYDGVHTNPTERCVVDAKQRYDALDCDGLVALGGGSCIDLAKCVGILIRHAGPLHRYAAVGGAAAIAKPLPPLLAIPTTAGSGSEVGRAALITLDDGRKIGFISPLLLPSAAICDPELTASMPPGLTAGSGMDAISHGIEAFCSPRWNPVADALALQGLQRGYNNIRRAVADGRDLKARQDMLLASIEVGLAFQKGLGAVHSLSHPLGGLTDRQYHHGLLNAVFLPHALRFNLDTCRDRLSAIASRLGVAGADSLAGAFSELARDIGLPGDLRSIGVSRQELPQLARLAAMDHCCATNPRALDEASCLALYEAAW